MTHINTHKLCLSSSSYWVEQKRTLYDLDFFFLPNKTPHEERKHTNRGVRCPTKQKCKRSVRACLTMTCDLGAQCAMSDCVTCVRVATPVSPTRADIGSRDACKKAEVNAIKPKHPCRPQTLRLSWSGTVHVDLNRETCGNAS
eukprot:g37695.t1